MKKLSKLNKLSIDFGVIFFILTSFFPLLYWFLGMANMGVIKYIAAFLAFVCGFLMFLYYCNNKYFVK